MEPTKLQEVKGGNGLSHGENWKLDEIGLKIVANHPIIVQLWPEIPVTIWLFDIAMENELEIGKEMAHRNR